MTYEKKDQVARIEVRGGGGFRGFGKCPKENVFFVLMSSLKDTDTRRNLGLSERQWNAMDEGERQIYMKRRLWEPEAWARFVFLE